LKELKEGENKIAELDKVLNRKVQLRAVVAPVQVNDDSSVGGQSLSSHITTSSVPPPRPTGTFGTTKQTTLFDTSTEIAQRPGPGDYNPSRPPMVLTGNVKLGHLLAVQSGRGVAGMSMGNGDDEKSGCKWKSQKELLGVVLIEETGDKSIDEAMRIYRRNIDRRVRKSGNNIDGEGGGPEPEVPVVEEQQPEVNSSSEDSPFPPTNIESLEAELFGNDCKPVPAFPSTIGLHSTTNSTMNSSGEQSIKRKPPKKEKKVEERRGRYKIKPFKCGVATKEPYLPPAKPMQGFS